MPRLIQVSIAFLATAAMGVAIAQGTPPNPAVANPALGAGQQSSQSTSMGTTGTPGSGGTTAGSSMNTSPSSAQGSTSMGMSDNSSRGSASTMRRARADRN